MSNFEFNHPNCVCGSSQFFISGKNGIKIARCEKCGIISHANFPFTSDQKYIDFYRDQYPPVKKDYIAKTYSHDRQLAEKRCIEYGIEKTYIGKILDVGSGSGAFVDECRDRGAEAYGCEISKYHYSQDSENAFVYRQRLEDINFPTDYFDMVTCHDTLEHVLDPVNFIEEMFRALKQDGICIIDFPHFFHEAGKHHWKKEHLWYFTPEQLEKILGDIGFVVDSITNPLESKVLLRSIKPKQKRVKILFPPGIGDTYWSIVKLQAFLKRENLGMPDVYVVCNKNNQNQGHIRAFPFLEMFPFMNATWESFENKQYHRKLWLEAYSQKGRTIFQDVQGCDYFISYCGNLSVGKSLEEIDSDLQCNWFPPMFISLEQEHFKNNMMQRGGYIVFYFVFGGTYQFWTKEFPVNTVIRSIQGIVKQTGCIPVFAGAKWDKKDLLLNQVKKSIPDHIDLVGKTTMDQLFGLIKGSELVIGYPSGLTVMAAALRKKTLILWHGYYNNKFHWNACPPSVKNTTYFIEDVRDLTSEHLIKRVKDIIRDNIIRDKGWNKRKPANKTKIRSPKQIGQVRQEHEGVAVVCVLKSGGDFTVDYVRRLRNMVARNTTVPYEFICFSDFDIDPDICESVKLKHNYNKWWSKIELFDCASVKADYMIYFDLDTVIVSNIDSILKGQYDFMALKPWNASNRNNGMCASGMMAWKNDGRYSFVYEQFDQKKIKNYSRGDQEYISKILDENGKFPVFYQDIIQGIYSYKRNRRRNDSQLPANAKIMCFHGRPRPKDVRDKWVVENWK